MAMIQPIRGGSSAHPVRSAQSPSLCRPVAEQGTRFDHVEFSPEPSGELRFHRELVTRISREVRSAITTGDIQELQRQVQGGEYRPDPAEIAARMLLQKGAVI